MKKKFLVLTLALASSFALTGCNKSHSVKPADGTAVESVEGAKKLAAAADKVVSYDAVSLSLKDAEITSKFNGYSLNTNAAQKGYETYPLKVEESLSGLSLTLGAKGLTATKNTDFVAAAKLKSNLSLTAKHESPTAPVDFSYSGSGLEVGAYVANTNVYLDASNQAFMDLINKYVSSMVNTMTSGQANVSITYPPFKGVMTGLLAKLPAPLLSPSMIQDIQENAASLQATIAKLPDYFHFQSYDDGTYSVYVSFSHDDLVALVDSYIDGQQGDSYSGPTKEEMNKYLGFVTVNACEAAAYFSDTVGLTEFDVNLDVKEESTLGDAIGIVSASSSSLTLTDEQKAYKNTSEAHVYTRFALAYGDEAVVELPSDLDSYEPFVMPTGLGNASSQSL